MKILAIAASLIWCLIVLQGCSNDVNSTDKPKIDYSLMGDTLTRFNAISVSFAGKHLYDTPVTPFLDEYRMSWSSDSGTWIDTLGMFRYVDQDGWDRSGSAGSKSSGHTLTHFKIDPETRSIAQIHDSSHSYSWNNIPMEVQVSRGIEAKAIPLISIDTDSAVFGIKGAQVADKIVRVDQRFFTYYRYWYFSDHSRYLHTAWNETPEPELRIVLSRK